MNAVMDARVTRPVLVFFSCTLLFIASRLWVLRHEETFLPGVWPIAFGVAGLCCLWLAADLTSHLALYVSGPTLATALAGRAAAVLLNFLQGTVAFTDARAQLAGAVYLLGAALAAGVWLYVLRPRVELERARRGP